MTVQSRENEVPYRRRRGIHLTERHLPIALLFPSIVILLLVVGFPMLYSLYISFTNFNLTSPGNIEFIGLQNYSTLLFDDPLFWTAFGRTILFISLAVNLEFIIGLAIAHLMSRVVRGQGLARTLIMMPMMFAPILVGFQFKWFFNAQVGLVNNILYSITGNDHEQKFSHHSFR